MRKRRGEHFETLALIGLVENRIVHWSLYGQVSPNEAAELLAKSVSSFRGQRPGTRGVVIDWTRIGLSPPMPTSPTRTSVRASLRARAVSGTSRS